MLLDGECDVFQLSNLASSSRMPGFSPDPTRTAFGGRTNTLVAGAYFGERALVTNEPRAASIVAATNAIALIIYRALLLFIDSVRKYIMSLFISVTTYNKCVFFKM